MSADEPVRIPQAVFGTDRFWRRLDQLADAAGHREHPRWLAGRTDPDNAYMLWCQRCNDAVIELLVDRTDS